VNVLLAVFWKDLLTEWRSRDRLLAMGTFAALVVIVLYFAAPPGVGSEARRHVPGLLWVAYVFASVLGLKRAFALELENEALSGLALAPADRGWIFLGKAAASLLLLLIVQAGAALVFALAFDVAIAPVALRFAAVAFLGALGLCSIGTLFAAIAVRTTFREVMLPLLLLPLLVPVLLGAVRATSALLLEGALPWPPIRLLLVTDAVFLILSFISFEYVLDD
jgi:heme exporter protein B